MDFDSLFSTSHTLLILRRYIMYRLKEYTAGGTFPTGNPWAAVWWSISSLSFILGSQSLSYLECERFRTFVKNATQQAARGADAGKSPFSFSFCSLVTVLRPGHIGIAISRFIGCVYSVLKMKKGE
jgi:hypothetical protein